MIGAISGAALVVAIPATSSSAPPDIQLTPTSGPAGTKIGVQVHFADQCDEAGVGLTDPAAGKYDYLALTFSTPNANGNANANINVPANTAPGVYTVSSACLPAAGLAESDLNEATASFTVTGPAVPEAAVQISPTEGPPGTAIDVALAITPSDYCAGNAAVALRSTEGPAQASIVDLAIDLPPPPSPGGPSHATLHVPLDAPVDTLLYVDGGCSNGPLVSPSVAFLVTGPTQTLSPWWQLSKFQLEKGLSEVELLLSSAGGLPVRAVAPTVTTTTRPRTSTTIVTLPPPPPPPSTTTTTDPNAPCPPNCKP